jgi:hypothetical protein
MDIGYILRYGGIVWDRRRSTAWGEWRDAVRGRAWVAVLWMMLCAGIYIATLVWMQVHIYRLGWTDHVQCRFEHACALGEVVLELAWAVIRLGATGGLFEGTE